MSAKQPRPAGTGTRLETSHRDGESVPQLEVAPRSIGGALDFQTLARLNFTTLTEAEQHRAVRNMAKAGYSETTIASACGWSREMVQRSLGKLRP